MAYKYSEAEAFAERLHSISKNLKDAEELYVKAKYFTLLEQSYDKVRPAE